MKGVRQGLIRSMNDKLICELLRAHGALSRVELAERARMSIPAALKIVSRLEAAGLVQSAGSDDVLRPGPRARLFTLTYHGVLTSLHIDAQTLRVAHTDLAGRKLGSVTTELDPHSPAEQILRASESAWPEQPQMIVVGLPGPVEPDSGELVLAELPEWPPGMGRRLQTESSALDVCFADATNLRAVAEQALSDSPKQEDFIWVELGEDLRLAMVFDGKLRRGAHDTAGDIGLFGQGAPDAAELAASIGAQHDPEFAWLTELSGRARSARWDQLASTLGPWLGSLAAFLDPQRVALGGPVASIGGALLTEALQRWFAANYPLTPPLLHHSRLGSDAVVQGAEVLGWHALVDHLLSAA